MANPFSRLKGAVRDNQATSVSCTLEGLTIALLRHAEIHEGLWQPTFTLGRAATNMRWAEAGAPPRLTPCAITFVTGVGLQRVEEPNELTVDAAVVNPKSRILTPAGVLASPNGDGRPH